MIPHFVLRRAFAPLGLAVAVAVSALLHELEERQRSSLAPKARWLVPLLGAAAGAGAGALLKKKPGAAAEGAAVGAVVGGAAGAAYGDAVAKKKEGYATQESALDAQISGLAPASRHAAGSTMRSCAPWWPPRSSSCCHHPGLRPFGRADGAGVRPPHLDISQTRRDRSRGELVAGNHRCPQGRYARKPRTIRTAPELQTADRRAFRAAGRTLRQRAKLAGLPTS